MIPGTSSECFENTFWSHSLVFESADVSLVICCFFNDIPRAFIHKLRAFIGEPQGFLPELVFQADVYVAHRLK